MAQVQPTQKFGLNIALLLVSAFIGGAGTGIYIPFIPLQALKMGAPEWAATSTVLALPSLVTIILAIPIGMYTDKTGTRREAIIIGLAVSAIATALLAFSINWVELIILRAVASIPYAFVPLYLAIAGLITPPKRRGLFLGLTVGNMSLGIGVSEIPSGFILNTIGYKGLYLLATTLLIVALALMILVRAPKVRLPTMTGTDLRSVISIRGVYLTAVSVTVAYLGWGVLYSSFSIVLSVVFRAPSVLIGALTALIILLASSGKYIWGPVVDKLGGKVTLLIGTFASAILTFIILVSLTNMWFYSILIWLATLFGAAGAPAPAYIVQRSVKPEYYSVVSNVVWLFMNLGSIVSGFAAGVFLVSLGLKLAVLITGIIELIGGIMMLWLPRI